MVDFPTYAKQLPALDQTKTLLLNCRHPVISPSMWSEKPKQNAEQNLLHPSGIFSKCYVYVYKHSKCLQPFTYNRQWMVSPKSNRRVKIYWFKSQSA